MHISLTNPVARDRAVAPYDVKQLKKALNRLRLYTPPDKIGITGFADTPMFDALKQFQTTRGLKINGTIKPDDETIAAINAEISVTPTGSYIWRSVGDNKVRGAHAAFNGTTRSWADSPDPGEDYNCRCWAVAMPADEPGLGGVYPEVVFVPALSAAIRVTAPAISGAVSAIGTRISRDAIKRAVRDAALKLRSSNKEKWLIKNDKQLQKKFKHAKDFGIKEGINKDSLEKFRSEMQRHLDNPDTVLIKGMFHQ